MDNLLKEWLITTELLEQRQEMVAPEAPAGVAAEQQGDPDSIPCDVD